MTRRATPSAALLLVMLGAGVAVGVLSAGLWVEDPPPVSLAAPTALTSIPVAMQSFDNPEDVTVEVTVPTKRDVRARVSGIVTGLACAPGESWSSGTAPLSLDGRPLLALYTSTPLWRPLAAGLKGPDVLALKDELSSLGRPVGSGDSLSSVDLRSFNELLNDNAVESQSEREIETSEILWLPDRTVSIASCVAGLGDRISQGDTLLKTQAPPSMQIADWDRADSDGPWVLQIGNVRAELAGATQLSVPAQARDFLRTSQYEVALAAAGEGTATVQLAATVRLREPIEVTAVPPTSVHLLEGKRGCVMSEDGTTYLITAMSSSMGRSLVHFATPEHPSRVSLTAPSSCPS